MRRVAPLLLAALAALAVLAAPASAAAKHRHRVAAPPHYTYTATIDCGSGPVVVASSDDLFAQLVNRTSGKRYQPVEWDVTVGTKAIRAVRPGKHAKHTAVCTYDDGTAVGTVTVQKAKRTRCRPTALGDWGAVCAARPPAAVHKPARPKKAKHRKA
jgi:hypothetical protein